jgi:hypothetical protein
LKRKKQRKERDRGGSGSGREKCWRRSVWAEKKEKGKKRKKLVYFCDAIFDLQSTKKKKNTIHQIGYFWLFHTKTENQKSHLKWNWTWQLAAVKFIKIESEHFFSNSSND